MNTLKIYDIAWEVKGAGPSPVDNYRTEIYFAGCAKAREGNPCEGCCNFMIWDNSTIRDLDIDYIYKLIHERVEKQLPKYITFVGGEPTDQKDGVLELAKILKVDDFHILMFSWHSRGWFESNWTKEELKLFDIIITEPYIHSQRIYDWSKDDGLHNAVGSANQHIWYKPGQDNIDVLAGDIKELHLNRYNELSIVKF